MSLIGEGRGEKDNERVGERTPRYQNMAAPLGVQYLQICISFWEMNLRTSFPRPCNLTLSIMKLCVRNAYSACYHSTRNITDIVLTAKTNIGQFSSVENSIRTIFFPPCPPPCPSLPYLKIPGAAHDGNADYLEALRSAVKRTIRHSTNTLFLMS